MTVADGSTYTNQYQLLISPPTSTTNSTIQTIQQNIGFNQILDLQNNGGTIKLEVPGMSEELSALLIDEFLH